MRRVLLGIAGFIVLAIAALAELYFVQGTRVEFTGNMKFRRIVWGSERKKREAELEASRAQQQPAPAQPAGQAVKILPPAAQPAASTAVTAAKLAPVSYWTDFRGPHRDGVYSEEAILTDWPASGLRQLWKQPIGGGYSSFTFGEGRAYTIEQRRDKEAVTAYDPETGRELWAFTYPASFDEPLGGPGPRATPVYHEGLVYSMGANGDLYCLIAATGKPKWSKNILSDNLTSNAHWAMAAAPLLAGGKVIVTPGGPASDKSARSIVAYDAKSGAPIWHALSDRAGYSSPIAAKLNGVEQIVWLSGERVVGVAAADGKLLWEFPYPASMDMNCAQPMIVDKSHVLVSSSDAGGAVMLEISNDGAKPLWETNRFKNKFNSAVIRDGYAYGFDEAILACIDVKTGELKWKGGRYGYGQLILAGDNLVITTEEGDVVLVKAVPDAHHELARFSAIEGKTWNIPAIDHGLLLVRNASQMACFRIGRNPS